MLARTAIVRSVCARWNAKSRQILNLTAVKFLRPFGYGGSL